MNLDIKKIKDNIDNIEYFCLKKNSNYKNGYEPLKALIHKKNF